MPTQYLSGPDAESVVSGPCASMVDGFSTVGEKAGTFKAALAQIKLNCDTYRDKLAPGL